MTRRMLVLNAAGRSLIAGAILICAADRLLTRMNRRQRAVVARIRARG